jgi:quercetin dioxygenase-like cupin family protein
VVFDALQVKIPTNGLCETPPHAAMFPHGHTQEEALFVLEGHVHVNIRGLKGPIRPGTQFRFPSCVEHVTTNEVDGVTRFAFWISPLVVVGRYDKGNR